MVLALGQRRRSVSTRYRKREFHVADWIILVAIVCATIIALAIIGGGK